MAEMTRCPRCGSEYAADAREGLCPQCLLKAALGNLTDDPENSPSPSRFSLPSLEELTARFPHLDLISLLGKGGMGAVYKARQKGLDRLVALKILLGDVGRDPTFTERFAREARVLARLRHPGIVAIHDFGQVNELCYFVMEYVDGPNLRQVTQGALPRPELVLGFVPQICEALQYAHDAGCTATSN